MTIVALAGRRIDAAGAPARFPLDQAERVKEHLGALLRELRPSALVCSAACGADLLALEAAAALHIPATIVLPFEPDRFRASSVVDRPGDWGPRFDAVMKRAASGATADRVHVIEKTAGAEEAAYVAATDAILEEALALAATTVDGENQLIAVVVWDGVSRGEGDLTEHFRRSALSRGFTERMIATLPSA